jgi:hypothetical protein
LVAGLFPTFLRFWPVFVISLLGFVVVTLGVLIGQRCGDIHGCDETHLYYPGAKILSLQEQRDAPNPPNGYCRKPADKILASKDSPAAIYRWYDEHLVPRGWRAFGRIQWPEAISTTLYERGQDTFYLGVDDPILLARNRGITIPPSTVTVFEIGYLFDPTPCPGGLAGN